MKTWVPALAAGLSIGNLLAWNSPLAIHLAVCVLAIVGSYLVARGYRVWARRYEGSGQADPPRGA